MPTTYAIPNGASVMAATTYTGNGGTQPVMNAVNSVGFQPDLVWIKSRSNAYNNLLNDSVRGVGQSLVSNDTGAELNYTAYFTAFSANGFSLAGGSNAFNSSSVTYVGWQWKAGGTSVSNTAGSLTSQISANTTAGFSVATYTGTGVTATVGHGLGVAPQMVIIKNRAAAESWRVGHSFMNGGSSPWNYYMNLNGTAAQTASSAMWNNTAPSSTVFTISNDSAVSGNGQSHVAYCFAPVAGYSAIGYYTGNGSTDGPFVYMGFRPRWFMSKRSDTAGNDWVIMDTSRDTYNVANQQLYADLNLATETNTVYETDFLSNGLKIRTSTASRNASGSTYIYIAFAENPFKYANAR